MSSSAAGLGQDVLGAVVDVTRRVGRLLREMQSGGAFDTQAKGDGSPVTRADRAAHDILARELPGIVPLLVVSEESGPQENAERMGCERVWIVDPLDGTKEYIRGSNEFTVNVALVEHGVPVLGVMDSPGLGLTYFAERGRGAFRSLDGAPAERITCARTATRDARIVVSGSDRSLSWSSAASLAGVRVEAVSSCVKLGYVAEGSALAYPRLTGSSEWDIAAGHAVVLEAGGRVIGIDGRDLTYNKANPLNTAFVATGSPLVAAEFATILGPALAR